MNRNTIYESDIEEASLGWLADLGYTVLHGPDIAPDTPDAERASYSEVLLTRRLRPDKREKAAETVLEQAEVLCNDWAALK